MTANEQELISLIRENDKPGEALMTAVVIALGFLKQHGESLDKVAADLPVFS